MAWRARGYDILLYQPGSFASKVRYSSDATQIIDLSLPRDGGSGDPCGLPPGRIRRMALRAQGRPERAVLDPHDGSLRSLRPEARRGPLRTRPGPACDGSAREADARDASLRAAAPGLLASPAIEGMGTDGS